MRISLLILMYVVNKFIKLWRDLYKFLFTVHLHCKWSFIGYIGSIGTRMLNLVSIIRDRMSWRYSHSHPILYPLWFWKHKQMHLNNYLFPHLDGRAQTNLSPILTNLKDILKIKNLCFLTVYFRYRPIRIVMYNL